jgi:hypothetical protein
VKILFVLLCLTSRSYAWEISSKDGSNFLLDEDSKIKEEIISHPTARKLETREINKDIILLTYLENLGGTKNSSESYNCAAYSKKGKKLLFKDLACRSIIIQKNGEKEIEEATFKVEEDNLLYVFDELKQKFDLPK